MKENTSVNIHLSILFFCTLIATAGIIIGWDGFIFFNIFAIYSLWGSGIAIVRSLLGIRGLASFLLAPLAALTPLTIVGSAIYIVSALTFPAYIFLLWIPFITAFVASRTGTPPLLFLDDTPHSLRTFLFGFAIFILIILQIIVLVFSRTTSSLLGPWDGMNPLLFLLYGFSTLLLIAWFTIGKKISSLHLIALCAQYFISFSVALIRFPLTFGFDPLLHQAAERLVLEQGSVAPKTLYYIGQYVTVPFIARTTHLSVEPVHQFFLPLLLALSLPALLLFALHAFKKAVANTDRALLLAPLLLSIPYPHLIMTTPWGLAYGITIAVVLSSALASLGSHRFHSVAVALTMVALAFHPLAGIPLFFFLLLALTFHHAHRFRAVLLSAQSALGAVSVPFALWLNSLISSQGTVTLQFPPALDARILAAPRYFLETRFTPLLDVSYVAADIGWLFFALAAITGCWITIKKNALPPRLNNLLRACILTAGMTFVSGALTGSVIRFDTLAQSEQYDYSQRLFSIAALFLLPVGALPFARVMKKIFAQKNPLFAVVCVLLLAGGLLASWYRSYPRNDAFVPSHAYTLSSADIATVRFIDADAGAEPYAVLANQVIASAAIREYGFKKYFTVERDGTREQVFYYPVPSGSSLAQYYDAMLRQPSRQTAERAMDMLGISRMYFVVRDYEFRFPIIIRDGKTSADEWRDMGGGEAFVFMYRR